MVLEKTLESPSDCKEIQLVHSEGDQPWDFFGMNDAKAETPVLWPPHAKSCEVKLLSRVRRFATPWTVAYQALPSMGFSRQEYWSGLPFPSPGKLPNPGMEPGSPAL